MGQAKNRGSFEERKALAVAKREAEQQAEAERRKNRKQGVAVIGGRAGTMAMVGAALAASEPRRGRKG